MTPDGNHPAEFLPTEERRCRCWRQRGWSRRDGHRSRPRFARAALQDDAAPEPARLAQPLALPACALVRPDALPDPMTPACRRCATRRAPHSRHLALAASRSTNPLADFPPEYPGLILLPYALRVHERRRLLARAPTRAPKSQQQVRDPPKLLAPRSAAKR